MKNIMHWVLVVAILPLISAVYADDWSQSTVKAIHTRANGNVVFRTDTPTAASPCSVKDGWEMHRDNINFKENVALLLSAYSSKSVIRVQYVGVPCETWGHAIVNEIMIGNFW